MITVKYEEYTNDFIRQNKTKTFYSLSEFENWFFGLCDSGKFDDKIFVPIPERTDIWGDGPSRMEVNCVRTQNKCYWVHQIERNGAIIFSDGKFTDRQRHWNDETKELCRAMNQRKKKPVFNFA